jgi:hypothetical protein
MPHAGFSSFTPAPVLDALRPLQRLIHRATQPCRHTDQGKLYLGDGQPVMVFPVFGGGAESTWRLRLTLRDAGFRPHDWGLGVDEGPGDVGLSQCLRRLEEQVIEVFEDSRRTVTLLGWGLSGIYAREVAKRMSPLVRQVITLGTPFRVSGESSRHCAMLRALCVSGERTEASLWMRLRQRPPVPFTSIYSESDAVVPWQMCMEVESPDSENIRIESATHLELPLHPQVLEVVSHRLAQPEDDWRPYGA